MNTTGWKSIGTARYDGTCALCGECVRARKDHSVWRAADKLIAHESCYQYACEASAGAELELPDYVTAGERTRVERGRPVWAARLRELTAEPTSPALECAHS